MPFLKSLESAWRFEARSAEAQSMPFPRPWRFVIFAPSAMLCDLRFPGLFALGQPTPNDLFHAITKVNIIRLPLLNRNACSST